MFRKWPKILFLVGFWLVVAVFITVYDASLEGFTAEERGGPFTLWWTLLTVSAVTVLGGTLMAWFEVSYLSRVLRKRPYGFVLLAKTAFYLACMFTCISIVIISIDSFDHEVPVYHPKVMRLYTDFVTTPRFFMTILFWSATVFISLFVLQVSEKFGQGVLANFLLGKYHRPKQQHRIFMFLDLRSSTTLAERLGHEAYSRLIQDCFYDMTNVVLEHKAEVYQYIGDEVVLTWLTEKGLEGEHCVATFYAYCDALNEREQYYMTTYGVVPEFKAGVNLGDVMVAEVGEIKKDLAYHGDALNTAARIQGKCNEIGSPLLISGELKSSLGDDSAYEFELVGDLTLRGRSDAVAIYSVTRSADGSLR